MSGERSIPKGTRILYAGTRKGFFVLAKLPGREWETHSCGLADTEVRSLAVDPFDGITAYVGTTSRGLLRGTVAGPEAGQWEPVRAPMTSTTTIVAHRASKGVVVAGSDPASLYLSSDRGDTWRELAGLRSFPGRQYWWAPDGSPKVSAVALHPNVPGVIYAGIEMGGLLGTDDGGSTWVELGEVSKDVHALDFHPQEPDVIFATTGQGLFRSVNRGAAWKPGGRGIDERFVEGISLHPREPEVMVASAAATPTLKGDDVPGAVYRTSDGGEAWKRVSSSSRSHVRRHALVSSRTEPGLFYCGNTEGEVFASEDAGESWSRIGSGLPPILSVAIAESASSGESFDFTAVASRMQKGESSTGKCPFFA
ncbi:MAG TPA: hypothetical protein VI893_00155 [Thermoplasmata archaeon]|nr:hypothetical protein [Thermoplasmata archaeon]